MSQPQTATNEGGESFASLFEESLTRSEMRMGEVITAEVVRVEHSFVVVNAGLKSEAYVPIEEFKNDHGELEVQVGDFVSVAGVTGTVVELGLFTTTINTPDNVQTILGNNKVFSETIQNFTVNPFRRVDLKCQLAGAADHQAAMALLREKIAAIPNVLPEPKVDVEILDFNLVGPVLAVRPYCHNDNYWQVYFDSNRVIREALAEAGFPAPMPAQNVIVTQAA
jgi:hypothetical protein